MYRVELVTKIVCQVRDASTYQVRNAQIALVAGSPASASVSSLILRR